jgi:hypothetical protein
VLDLFVVQGVFVYTTPLVFLPTCPPSEAVPLKLPFRFTSQTHCIGLGGRYLKQLFDSGWIYAKFLLEIYPRLCYNIANICIVYYTVLRRRLYLVEQEQILQKISEQMDMLVSLFKLANSETINKEKEKIFKDPVKAKIIEVVPEDLPANELVSRVSSEVKQKERTIRYRLSELVAMGILKIEREGNKSFYRSSGLI